MTYCLIHGPSLMRFLSVIIFITYIFVRAVQAEPLMPEDVLALAISEPDATLKYAEEDYQYGELRLPKGEGPHPVAATLHGGCWVSHLTSAASMAPMASALTNQGIATWNIEFRGGDQSGGGWPGTYMDIANAIDHLRVLAEKWPLDLRRVVLIGHSSGGHLALWAAARHKLAQDSRLFVANPLPIHGVVNLSGPGDLKAFHEDKVRACGDNIVMGLVNRSSEAGSDLYRNVSPLALAPFGVEHVVITGALDTVVPPRFGEAYQRAAQEKGDKVSFYEIEEAAHFDIIAPGTDAWVTVEKATLELLGMAD